MKVFAGVLRRNYDYDRFWMVFPRDAANAGSDVENLQLVVRVKDQEGRVEWPATLLPAQLFIGGFVAYDFCCRPGPPFFLPAGRPRLAFAGEAGVGVAADSVAAACPLCFAHLAFSASEIRLRASADMVRLRLRPR